MARAWGPDAGGEVTTADIITGILKAEGWPAVTNRAADRGGWTKGGITLETLSAWLGRPATVDELRALDEQTARQIYALEYIIRPNYIGINDEHLRAFVVDIAVMSGPSVATTLLQRALGVTVDGDFGPITLAAVNTHDPRDVVDELLYRRAVWLARVVMADPALVALSAHDPAHAAKLQSHNLAGWLERTFAFRSFHQESR